MARERPFEESRVVLTTLRALAIVIVSTGLNDVIAGALPRYEPLYAYMATVAVVVLLDGAMLGLLTAVLATLLYALLFLPRDQAFTVSTLIPAAALVGTAAVAGVVRAVAFSQRRQQPAIFTPPAMPLLPASPLAPQYDEVLAAIEDLRSEFRSAVHDAAEAREREKSTADELRALQESSRLRDERLQTMYEEARRVLENRARVAEERLAAAQQPHAPVPEAEETHRAELREQIAARARAHVTELEHEWKAARASLEARLEHVEEERGHLVVHLDAARREAGEAMRQLADAQHELANARAQLGDVRTELADARRQLSDLHRESEQLATARQEAEAQSRARLMEAEASLGLTRDEAATLAGRVTELEIALAQNAAASRDWSAEKERLSADVRRLGEEATTMRARAASHVARVAELELAGAEAASLRGQIETLRHELAAARQRGEAQAARVAELELAGAETLSLRGEVETLRQQLASAVKRGEEQTARAEAEKARGEAERTRADTESARAEAEAARVQAERRRADAESARADAEQAARARAATEFDEKLQTIVSHLAADHEADLGRAVEEKEAARAEARSLSMRASTLQKKVEEAEAEIRSLHGRLAASEPGAPVARDSGAAMKARVLVVHPDAEIRASASATIERMGYAVASAADGLEALRIAAAEQPHVIIAETIMPKMNGRELCQLVKSQERTAEIRVVLLARASDEAPKGDIVPDTVLRKPVPLETLRSTLADLVAAARTGT